MYYRLAVSYGNIWCSKECTETDSLFAVELKNSFDKHSRGVICASCAKLESCYIYSITCEHISCGHNPQDVMDVTGHVPSCFPKRVNRCREATK